IRQPAALITITASPDGQQLGATWLNNASTPPELESQVGHALADRQSRTVTVGETRYFIEVILPAIHIAAFGGSYDIPTLQRQTLELGWDFTVINKKNPQTPPVDDYTAILLMSHDYNTDKRNLERVLPTRASYIGILGPHKRADK